MTRLHDDELDVDVALVERLLAHSFPALTGPIAPLGASGSSNALFRCGERHVVRLPRQPGGGASIEKEAHWLPRLAPHLPVPVPEVVGVGEPGFGYPERWAVTAWLDGVVASAWTGSCCAGLGRQLAGLVAAIRDLPLPGDRDLRAHEAALTSYRAGRLADLDDDFRETVEECEPLGLPLDLGEVQRVWDDAVAASRTLPPGPPRWLHGDLLGENLLLTGAGDLAALLDLGGLAIGDPAVDLAVAWDVLDARERAGFRDELGLDDATWAVSRGWALLLGMITFPYYGATMPERCAGRLALVWAATAG